jgi:hypothetical protein
MTTFTLAEAAKAIGRDKSTLARAVRTGRLSASRDADGVWRIDQSELRRVYPVETSTPGAAVGTTPGAAAVAVGDAPNYAPGTLGDALPDTGTLQQVLARLADAHDQIAYLRGKLDRTEQKLDRATEELAAERAKVTALLTDQRPPPAPARRSWWPWRRG